MDGTRLSDANCLQEIIEEKGEYLSKQFTISHTIYNFTISHLPNGSNCINNSQDTNYNITRHLVLHAVSACVT